MFSPLFRRYPFISLVMVTILVFMMVSLATRHTLFAEQGDSPIISQIDEASEEVTPEDGPAGATFLPVVSRPYSGFNNCRYGVATLSGAQNELIDELGAGWHLNFSMNIGPTPNGSQFVPVIRVTQDKLKDGTYLDSFTAYPSIATADPNAPSSLRYWLGQRPVVTWIVGNEVDRGPNPGSTVSGQGDIYPAVYARAYHDIYQYIKQYDPTATVAISALVQVTPGRLQYLDKVWDAYLAAYGTTIPVDVWNMHLYILPELDAAGNPNSIANIALDTNPALGRRESGGNTALCALDEVYCFAEHDDMTVFAEQIVDMRIWMKNHGQQNKPLILSEYSLLYPYEDKGNGNCFLQDEYGNCFTRPRVITFMTNSFNYMETAIDPNLGYPLDGNRLIQQWLWFSISHGTNAGSVSNLTDDEVTLNEIGQMFRNTVMTIPPTVNLIPDQASNPIVFAGAGTADVNLWLTFRNNGNTALRQPFSVTFYANAALTNVIGTAIVSNDDMIGCGQQAYQASTIWNNLPVGTYPFWAKVDSTGTISESDENDNVITGTVTVNESGVLLPVIHK